MKGYLLLTSFSSCGSACHLAADTLFNSLRLVPESEYAFKYSDNIMCMHDLCTCVCMQALHAYLLKWVTIWISDVRYT